MDKHALSKITTYQAGIVQASMHRLLQKKSDEILKPFGITKMQWMIIGSVLEAGSAGARISDLAESIGTTIPYLTNSINLLESRGILIRATNDKDSRSKLVTVSPSFARKCKQIEAELREGLRKAIYSRVDPVEFSIYIKVMYELMDVGKDTKPTETAK